jgi:leucyl-tRNA synthetase
LSFSEIEVLEVLVPYVKKNLKIDTVKVMTVDEARARADEPGFIPTLVEAAEPGTPAFIFFNVV